MNLTIEMHRPAERLLEELRYRGITQASVAITYAFAIAQETENDRVDWPKLNAAIQGKWRGKTALVRIKTAAWKQIERWADGQ